MFSFKQVSHQRVQMSRVLWWSVILLGCGLLSVAQAGKRKSVEPRISKTDAAQMRVPSMRALRKGTDDAVRRRIEFYRAKLPAKFRKRNNFAWAVAKIPGLDKEEYFAHSGIQSFKKLSKNAAKKIEGISLKPKKGRFKAFCVNRNDIIDGNDCWVRSVDTEYKILEDMATRLPDASVKGSIRLYTDLPPCASCWNVMQQFLAAYPHIEMQVLHKKKRRR